MLQDMINPIEQLSMEGISSPIAAQILDFPDEGDIDFFADDLQASDHSTSYPNIATISTPITTTTASCHNEGICCYIDNDDDSFDFDPATISTLLNSDDTTYQLPENLVYIGDQDQNQNELNQILLTDMNASWPNDSPDSVIPPDSDTDTRPGWMSWPCYASEAVGPITDGPPIQMMQQPPIGYVGMDPLSTCGFLDTGIIGRYQAMGVGDGQMGFFCGTRADSGVGGDYGPESAQRVYGSIDMQVMGDYKSLVEGCNSNPTAMTTSEITPLDDSTLKVGRLSPEERKEKIHRYLKKRTERNFNKKIKYACRKTLADSRPRVRGRFAKNDEHVEGTSRQCSSNQEYYDGDEAVVKEEQDMLNSSDIFAHISGVNPFNCNYTLESWI